MSHYDIDMLPDYLLTHAPLFNNHIKRILLESQQGAGSRVFRPDRYIDWMDHFSQRTKQELKELSPREINPDLDNQVVSSELTLPYHHRRLRSLQERFRKNQVMDSDLMLISDGATKLHWAMSRGLERRALEEMIYFDCEARQRGELADLKLSTTNING